MASPNRRQFVRGSLALAAGAAACGSLPGCAGNSIPAPTGPIDVGSASDYPTEGVYPRWAKTAGFHLVRRRGHLYALSSVCTHRRCVVDSQRGGAKFDCPCHGSQFDPEGIVLEGPATQPLPRHKIYADPAGRLLVDARVKFPREQWSDPESFVAM